MKTLCRSYGERARRYKAVYGVSRVLRGASDLDNVDEEETGVLEDQGNTAAARRAAQRLDKAAQEGARVAHRDDNQHREHWRAPCTGHTRRRP